MMIEEKLYTPYGLITLKRIKMENEEWKPLNGIIEFAEAVAAETEIQVAIPQFDSSVKWAEWNQQFWDIDRLYRARPRQRTYSPADRAELGTPEPLDSAHKPDQQEQDWIDRLAEQYGAKQAAISRGYTLAISKANHWLIELVHDHWPEIIAALRKERESAKAPDTKKVKSLCWRHEESGMLLWVSESSSIPQFPWKSFPVGDLDGEVEA